MQKLTVDQAAKELGIKKESVYKRVQRGTLPNTKDSDGHLYVYLDDVKGAEQDKSAEQDKGVNVQKDGNAGQNKRSLIDYFTQVAPTVAVAGGAIYIAGLVSLLAPISWSYTHDFDSAWYAVSLVPKTTVAGQGVRYLLGPAVLNTVWFIISLYLAISMARFMARFMAWKLDRSNNRAREEQSRDLKLSAGDVFEMLLILVLGVVAIWFVFDQAVANQAVANQANPGWIEQMIETFTNYYGGFANRGIRELLEDREAAQAIVSYATIFLGYLIGFLYWLLIVRKRTKDGSTYWEAVRIREGASIVFIWSLVTTLAALFLITEPPLPTAEITGNSGTDGTVTKGKVLSHTEGFWYVVKKDNIIAIPDGEVKDVKVLTPDQ